MNITRSLTKFLPGRWPSCRGNISVQSSR